MCSLHGLASILQVSCCLLKRYNGRRYLIRPMFSKLHIFETATVKTPEFAFTIQFGSRQKSARDVDGVPYSTSSASLLKKEWQPKLCAIIST